MTFKAKQIEVPSDEPFKNDALGRKRLTGPIVEFIRNVDGPFVLALNSPWGTGKSTFIKMLQATLESDGFPCLYFDSWRNDFASDPLVAFVGELEKVIVSMEPGKSQAKKKFQEVKNTATLLAKKAVPVAGKLMTAGILDLEKAYEDALSDVVEGALSDAIDTYSAERDLIEKFRDSLQSSVSDLLEKSDKDKIVVFVDELDRCRPTYAVDLLERVKHFFDVKNVVFVLSLDKEQLGISLGAVYGEKIDSSEYLRRFIDLEFTLPRAESSAFAQHLFNTFGLEKLFSDRAYAEFQYDAKNLLETFEGLADILDLSLRAREQCFTLIRIALLVTPSNFFIYPHLLTALAVLRIGATDVYRDYAQSSGSAENVVGFLRARSGGPEFLGSHVGTVVEAYLLAAKRSRHGDSTAEIDRVREASEDENLPDDVRERAVKIIRLIGHFEMKENLPSLDYVLSKLELASELKR